MIKQHASKERVRILTKIVMGIVNECGVGEDKQSKKVGWLNYVKVPGVM